MNRPFDKIVREARDDWGTREAAAIDWETVDKALFDRLDRERREDAARFARGGSQRWGVALAGTLALLVILLVAVGKGREAPSDGEIRVNAEENGGVIAAVEGRALVNRAVAKRGTVLHLGDVIDAQGRVTIDRPGRLTVVLERGSSATITHVRGALILALERGGVEASVVPVASGEAFAVDVDHSRIAAHGTHLRVARAGSQAVVDLSEGVISIGQAPRVGTVLGTLVVAPAHAEFAVSDAQGTLKVTHDESAVRSPSAFASASAAPAASSAPSQAKADASPAHAPSVSAPLHAEARSAAGATVAAPSEADTTAALSNAVRACMAERPSAENVTVVVKTTLSLVLQDDGSVRSARFDPPVAPDVNECATPAIYKARFTHGGVASLVLSYVSQ